MLWKSLSSDKPELFGDVLIDPQVRLMKEKQIDVVEREALLLELLHQRADHALDGVLEDEPPCHVREHVVRRDLSNAFIVQGMNGRCLMSHTF